MEQVIFQEIQTLRSELHAYRDEVADWKRELGERVTSIETKVKPAIEGNGQPSRLAVVEEKVSALEKSWWKVVGACSAVWGIALVAFEYFKSTR